MTKAYVMMTVGGHYLPVRFQGPVDRALLQLQSNVIFQSRFYQILWKVRTSLETLCTAIPDLIQPKHTLKLLKLTH